MKTKFVLTLMAATLALGITAVRADNKPRIGSVNAEKILVESKVGQRNQDILKRFVNEKKVIVDREATKLKAEFDRISGDLKKNDLIYSAKQKSEIQQSFREKEQRFVQMRNDAGAEIDKKRRELLGPAVRDIRAAIAEVAGEEKLMLVFDLNSLPLYAEPGPDITDKVMSRYNSKHGK